MTDPQIQEFFTRLRHGLTEKNLVRITLSKPRSKEAQPYKAFVKPAYIKGELMLTFTLKNATNDITKNFGIEEGIAEIERYLTEHFYLAVLFTTENDWLIKSARQGKFKLRATKPTFKEPADFTHDKQKNHAIKKADFLTELGVTDAKGRIAKDMGDKFKQINKFVEIIAGLLKKADFIQKNNTIKVTDMGAGKGYLTFAVYDYLVNKLKLHAEVVGVEIRPDLIKICNTVAQNIGFANLHFEEGYIGNYALPKTDILIALHACDTATDDAIKKGIDAEAELIICAPCCHKQIRKAMTKSETLESVLQYGILRERQAEIITDTMRALLLEANGYKTKVFEFISTEHTGKNVMIIGEKHGRKVDTEKYSEELNRLKKEFGIEKHYLEEALGVSS